MVISSIVTSDSHSPGRTKLSEPPASATFSATSSTLAFSARTSGPWLHAASGNAQPISITACFMNGPPVVGATISRAAAGD